MLRGILQNDLFYCNHLGMSDQDEQDIKNFTVRDKKGAGLLEYIRYYAFPEEDAGIMRTYMVRDNRTSELVGYFSLKAGLISLNEREEVFVDSQTGEEKKKAVFDTLPGVELANFAVNHSYVKANPGMKGVGQVIFDSFIVPIIRQSSESIGIKILYLFALPYQDLISRYEDYGFSRLDNPYEDQLHSRLKPFYDDSCKFMYIIL